MKKYRLTWLMAVLLAVATTAQAQQSLAGRTYHNANVMAAELAEATKDMDKKIAEARVKTIAEQEKKKGRKLTAKELAEVDQQLEEGRKMAEAMKKGMKTAVTMVFETDRQVVMKMDISISDEALKAAGIGWVKRKALKAALAVAPKSQKGTYVVKGDKVIVTDADKEKDTLRLSTDGQALYGKMDKSSFTLRRTK